MAVAPIDPETVDHRHRERRGAWAMGIAALLIVGYCFPFYDRIPNPNEMVRLCLTISVVEEGSLGIDSCIAIPQTPDYAVVKGRKVADKAPGISFLAIPGYLVAKLVAAIAGDDRPSLRSASFFARLTAVEIPHAVFCALLFLFLGRTLPSRRLRALVVLTFAAGTSNRVYASLLFGHETAAALVFGAFALLVVERERRRESGQAARPWRVAAAGVSAGMATVTEYPVAPLSLLVALYALYAVRPLPRVLAFAAAALPLGLAMLYHDAAFGHPFRVGYARVSPQFSAVHAEGLLGIGAPSAAALWALTFSLRRGLFALSPALLLALPGFVLMWRRGDRAETIFCLLAFTGHAVLLSGYRLWDGGDSIGPRHLVPAVPFLLPGVVHIIAAIDRWRPPILPLLVSGLCVSSIALCTVAALPYPYYESGYENPLRDVSMDLWRLGYFPYHLGRVLGLPGIYGILPYLIGLGALVLWAAVGWPVLTGPGRLKTHVLFATGCAAMAALALATVASLRPEARTRWAMWHLRHYKLRTWDPDGESLAALSGRPRLGRSTLADANDLALEGRTHEALARYKSLAPTTLPTGPTTVPNGRR